MPASLLSPRRTLLVIAGLLFINSLMPTRFAIAVGKPLKALHDTVVTKVLAAPLVSMSNSIRGEPEGEINPLGSGDAWTLLQNELGLTLQKNRQLQTRLDEAQAQIEQLTQARSIALQGVSLIDARVTSFSPGDGVKPMITIDRGQTRGIVKGAPVVSGFNLVGRVDAAYPVTSDVVLINAKGTKLQVSILPPLAQAPRELNELIELSADRKTFRLTVGKEDPVEVGDLAHLADDSWPSEAIGYVVGEVTSVAPDPRDPLNRKLVVITPIKPLESLSRVMALVPLEQK